MLGLDRGNDVFCETGAGIVNTWAPIWSGIVDSSLWEESGDVVKVFMTLLATKDSDHISRLDAYRIGKKCNLDEIVVLDILKVLASPDKRRKTQQDFEGRRIKAVEDGWLILNGQKYRDMVSKEMLKARNRRSQEAYRKRQKQFIGPPKTAEEKLAENGECLSDRL
jgi:hypothetical protein